MIKAKEEGKTITQHFIASTAKWEKVNMILPKACWGFEETNDGIILAKLGNGIEKWNDLKYFDTDSIKGLNEKLKQHLLDFNSCKEMIITETEERKEADKQETEARVEADGALDSKINSKVEMLLDDMNNTSQHFNNALSKEIEERIQDTADTLDKAKTYTDDALSGVQTIYLDGTLLTRIINGTTEAAKNLFPLDTVFTLGKTHINDVDGTLGLYVGAIDAATIRIKTLSISPVGLGETINLGTVQTHADIPLTVSAVIALFGRSPRVDDYVTVFIDETMQDRRVEWYIGGIDSEGNVAWGNPVPINTGDYQQQSGAGDAGKVLIGGSSPGTFGDSLPIDTEPDEMSNNLVNSGGIFNWFGMVPSALKTVVKNAFGAINELFDTLVTEFSYTASSRLLRLKRTSSNLDVTLPEATTSASGLMTAADKKKLNNRTIFGTCETSASTAAKTVAFANYTRETGSVIGVIFTNSNTVASGAAVTLNVNSTGAAQIIYNGTNPGPLIRANMLHLFMFDGTYWQLINPYAFLVQNPVGSIYMTCASDETTIEEMASKHGGTWVRWGMGRVPMGVGSSEANSTSTLNPSLAEHGGSMSAGAVNQTAAEIKGGNKSHKLLVAEIPKHSHTYRDASSTSLPMWSGNSNGNYFGKSETAEAGGDTAHNNIQPYITCYFYKRTA